MNQGIAIYTTTSPGKQAIVFTRNWGVPSGLALCRHENLLRLWFVGDGELLVVLVAFEHRVDVGIHQV
uniref:Uncharacterized protein n=1 Tax=Oryza glumipatula TaxID=40148 RepID=A0A0D9YA37_9ORYZ